MIKACVGVSLVMVQPKPDVTPRSGSKELGQWDSLVGFGFGFGGTLAFSGMLNFVSLSIRRFLFFGCARGVLHTKRGNHPISSYKYQIRCNCKYIISARNTQQQMLK